MSKGYRLTDATTGADLGTQTWDDAFAPIVMARQAASPFTAGGGTTRAGTFTSSTQSAGIVLNGNFNVMLWGTFSALVTLERSFDGGNTYVPASVDATGTPMVMSGPCSIRGMEEEPGVLYRLNCNFTSGTVNYRLSQ